MMKTGCSCMLSLVMLLVSGVSWAQSSFSVMDYQMLQKPMVATKPFQQTAWVKWACQNDYFLKELTTAELEGTILFGKRHALTCHLTHDGYSRYGVLNVSLGYALKMGGKFACGIQYHYMYHHVMNAGGMHSICFDISLCAQLGRKFFAAVEVYNPACLKYGIKGKDVIPLRFTIMMNYTYSEKLLFTVRLFKQLPGKFDVELGVFYRPKDFFYVSFALSLYEAGVGVMFRCRSVYFTTKISYNYNLGCSPQVGVILKINRLTAGKSHHKREED